MDRHDRRDRQRRPHQFAPSVEGLEGRQLPSLFGTSSNQIAYQASIVRHEYDQYVGELKRLELASQATPAEYLALRDDARAISAAASGANLSVSDARYKTVAASLDPRPFPPLRLGRRRRLGRGVVPADDDPRWPPGPPAPHRPDGHRHARPRGLGRESARTGSPRSPTTSTPCATASNRSPRTRAITSRTRASTTPSTSAASSAAGASRRWRPRRSSSGTSPRSVDRPGPAPRVRPCSIGTPRLLEGLGAAVPSATKDQFNATYVSAFAQGRRRLRDSPSSGRISSASWARPAPRGRVASVGRLVADAPAFYVASGESESNIQTIVTDVGTLVDAGGGETLNPFKVTIQPGRATPAAG